MTAWPFILLTSLLLVSCGGFKLWDGSLITKRQVAAEAVEGLLAEESLSFSEEISTKLESLYYYQILGQMNLTDFDRALEEGGSLKDLYKTRAYLNLIAIRTQAHEIERTLEEQQLQFEKFKSRKNAARALILKAKLREFSEVSSLHGMAIENLLQETIKKDLVTPQDIEKEYEALKDKSLFQIHEKNIDHLSHLLLLNLKSAPGKFAPVESGEGQVSGNEFPKDVWALTFNDGPRPMITQGILGHLKKMNLKATFFLVAGKVVENPDVALLVKKDGMEIASHSWTHQELHKVGAITLDREIKGSKELIERDLKVAVKFMRLPYGVGADHPAVRKKMSESKLIHATWNVDTLDWMSQNPEKIVARTKALMRKTPKNSGIILFHEVHHRSRLALEEVTRSLREENKRICTLGEIVRQMNANSGTICPLK